MEPLNRQEIFLNGTDLPQPITREEYYLAKANGYDVPVPEPQTRTEVFLKQLADNYLDTSDATATADKIVKDYTAYVNGEKVTGTLEAVNGRFSYFQTENAFTTQKVSIPFSPNKMIGVCVPFNSYASSSYICALVMQYTKIGGTYYYLTTLIYGDGTRINNNIEAVSYSDGEVTLTAPSGKSFAGGVWYILATSANIT